jgi:ATP-dependent Clp protease adaptor protein ClpS
VIGAQIIAQWKVLVQFCATYPVVPLVVSGIECDIGQIMLMHRIALPDLSDVPCCAEDDDSRGPGGNDQVGIATKTRAKPKKPSQFKVLMLNDDYTPMEFVVMVLKRFFHMDLEQATRVMLHVHQRGVGVCGIFPYEIAETKVNQVMDFARQNQHPLQCTLEKA